MTLGVLGGFWESMETSIQVRDWEFGRLGGSSVVMNCVASRASGVEFLIASLEHLIEQPRLGEIYSLGNAF